MSRIAEFASYCTSSQVSTFTGLDSASRLTVVKEFYSSHKLEIPASITVTTTKKGTYLTKDEKLAIQSAYIIESKTGKISPLTESNLDAVLNPDAVATFSETLPFSKAISKDGFGPSVVASKMIDSLSPSLNEEFHKIRKFDVPASIAISEIPAFIKELQAIYDANQK